MSRMNWTAVAAVIVIAGAAALADVEISEERSGDMLTEILKCEIKKDIKVSRLPGFLEVLISSKMSGAVRYLPVDNIRHIDVNDDGVYIRWEAERTRDGKGFITTVIYVPYNVLSPEKVIELLRDAMEGRVKRR
jgi:hypothetical protein